MSITNDQVVNYDIVEGSFGYLLENEFNLAKQIQI